MRDRRALGALLVSLLPSACSPDRELPPRYQDMAIPAERLASKEARERGRRLYDRSCALCHGEKGDGRGSRREGLARPPRDFTVAAFRRTTSPRRVFFAIREGLHGTPMPAWKALDESEIWDLVAFVRSLSESPEAAVRGEPSR